MSRNALRLLWPVAPVVLGAMVLGGAWHRWTVSALFALAAAVPFLLLRGALRVGLSRWASSAILLLLSVMVAYLATSGADLTLQQTLRDVVPRLLTAPLPYAARADLLVGPVLLTATVSLLVGLRAESRSRVEPVAGGAVLYVAGALLTDGAADPWGLVAVLLLVVALLGWVLLDEHSEPVRARLSVAAPVTVVGVGALAALATLPLSAPFSPRGLVDPPVYEVVSSNPLVQLGAWANNPTAELLRVTGDDVPLRLVVLDDYDGTQWSSSTQYTRLRTDGTTGLSTGAVRTDATVQVQFSGLGGQWLPSPGAPMAVGLPDALVDGETGTLYSPDPTTGLTYEVSGSYDNPGPAALEGASIPSDAELARFTALPTLPQNLAEYASRIASGAVTPYERATAIESQVRDTYRLSPRAISGSALWRIEDFLLGSRKDPGGRVGTSEQFATSFAVLARFNGLPTRVVVGFRPGTRQPDGSRVIRGEDAFAWAEVYFRDLGWVPFSPTPDDDTFARPRPVRAETPELPPLAETGTPSAVPSGGAPTTGAPTDVVAAPAPPPTGTSVRSLPTWARAVVALVAGLLLLLVARALRSWRHLRRGAIGAWSEVVDALRLAGRAPERHEPADVVAARADAQWRSGAAATEIARLAERSAFGPAGAGDPAGLTADLRVVRRAARRALPWWRRWWWHLDPRVLVPRAGR